MGKARQGKVRQGKVFVGYSTRRRRASKKKQWKTAENTAEQRALMGIRERKQDSKSSYRKRAPSS